MLTSKSLLTLAIGLLCSFCTLAKPPKREFYELKIYRIQGKEQENRLDAYLRDAYLPAAHRQGIAAVGVFKPIPTDTAAGKLVYVLTPLSSLDALLSLPAKLGKDARYQADGKDYLDAPYTNPPYVRLETIVLQAFAGRPVLRKPDLTSPKSERVYELRSYESFTEKLFHNKVDMFDKAGEEAVFDRLGFNPVFYGEVVAGRSMPNLMYLTTFADKASRDAHWKAFSADAEWGRIKTMPEYQHNVSKNTSYFLYPAAYSDL